MEEVILPEDLKRSCQAYLDGNMKLPDVFAKIEKVVPREDLTKHSGVYAVTAR